MVRVVKLVSPSNQLLIFVADLKAIVVDYRALIDYIYTGLSIGEEILFSNAPGLTSDFNFVPQELLDEKLEEFKKLYE